MKKKKIIIGLGVILAAAAAVVGGKYYLDGGFDFSKKNGTDSVYVDSVAKIIDPSVSGIMQRYSGVIEPQETWKIELSGDQKVKELYVKEGDMVIVGQDLFTYDTSEAEETLIESEIELDRLTSEIETSKTQIAAMKTELAKITDADEKMEYTNLIQTRENNLKKSEYDLQKQQLALEQLKASIANSTVQSQMEGVVKSINENAGSENYYGYSSDEDNAYITILALGDYRVKCTANEQNRSDIVEGTPVIVHSRVNEEEMWSGTMGRLDTENTAQTNTNYYYYGSNDNSSSNYNFYVDLDDSEGLILGQHVYIEIDNGQYLHRDGLWLNSYYISWDENDNPFVWAANAQDQIEMRILELGEYDAELGQYEILDGLTTEDYIAFPSYEIEEGMAAERNIENATITGGADSAIGLWDDYSDDYSGSDDYSDDYSGSDDYSDDYSGSDDYSEEDAAEELGEVMSAIGMVEEEKK